MGLYAQYSNDRSVRILKQDGIIEALAKMGILASNIEQIKSSLDVIIEDKNAGRGKEGKGFPSSSAANNVLHDVDAPTVTDGSINLLRSLVNTLRLLFSDNNIVSYRYLASNFS